MIHACLLTDGGCAPLCEPRAVRRGQHIEGGYYFYGDDLEPTFSLFNPDSCETCVVIWMDNWERNQALSVIQFVKENLT